MPQGGSQLQGTLINSVVTTQGHFEPLVPKLHIFPRPLTGGALLGQHCSGGDRKKTGAPHRLSRTRWAQECEAMCSRG